MCHDYIFIFPVTVNFAILKPPDTVIVFVPGETLKLDAAGAFKTTTPDPPVAQVFVCGPLDPPAPFPVLAAPFAP